MPLSEPLGSMSLAEAAAALTLSNVTAFQGWIGVNGGTGAADEAAESIHFDWLPEPADGDTYTADELADLRPCAVIWTPDQGRSFRKRRIATQRWSESGVVMVDLHRELPAGEDPVDHFRRFKNAVGLMIDPYDRPFDTLSWPLASGTFQGLAFWTNGSGRWEAELTGGQDAGAAFTISSNQSASTPNITREVLIGPSCDLSFYYKTPNTGFAAGQSRLQVTLGSATLLDTTAVQAGWTLVSATGLTPGMQTLTIKLTDSVAAAAGVAAQLSNADFTAAIWQADGLVTLAHTAPDDDHCYLAIDEIDVYGPHRATEEQARGLGDFLITRLELRWGDLR